MIRLYLLLLFCFSAPIAAMASQFYIERGCRLVIPDNNILIENNELEHTIITKSIKNTITKIRTITYKCKYYSNY